MLLFSQLSIPLLAKWWSVGTLFILGACIGSFLNVVVYRLPAGLSLVSPPSRCPKCETPIRAFDNVPILGWVLLRGRCRACSVWIPMRYPFVELTTAILFAYVGWTRGGHATASVNGGQSKVSENDLVGELSKNLSENGWAMLVSIVAASLLVVSICWFVDRVKMPTWFSALSIVVVIAAISLSSVPQESAVFVALGGASFLPYAMVRRKWDKTVPWQNLLVAGVLGAVLVAVR